MRNFAFSFKRCLAAVSGAPRKEIAGGRGAAGSGKSGIPFLLSRVKVITFNRCMLQVALCGVNHQEVK